MYSDYVPCKKNHRFRWWHAIPPTNFFVIRSSYEFEIEDEEFDLQEIDNTEFSNHVSLLDYSKQSYKMCMLKNHYRSKVKELINFSSHKFYNNELNILSQINLKSQTPIQEITLKNGLWENNKNEREADIVVKLVKNCYKMQPNKSLGIITFNAKEQKLFEDKLNEVAIGDGLMEIHQRLNMDNDESIFIKNIENVQGEERDIIIFSIVYGFNCEGNFANRFGPLSTTGGEKRLNVSITRAK